MDLVTVANSSKLGRIQKKFVALCYTRFFNRVYDSKHEDILVGLNFLTLNFRRMHLDARFLINDFKGKISCSPVLDTIGVLLHTRFTRDCFIVLGTSRAVPKPDVPSDTAVCRCIDIFNNKDLFCLQILIRVLNRIIFSYFSLLFNCIL
jgi:hypothetical protein